MSFLRTEKETSGNLKNVLRNKKDYLMNEILAKKLLFDVADVFERLEIEFFLAAGTCLGAYRERGFITGDDDVDIFVKAEELASKLQLWMGAVAKKRYRMVRVNKPFIRMNIAVRGRRKGGLHLDMNALFLSCDKRWILGPKIDVNFPAHFFESPERIDFLGRVFSVPTPLTEYLEWYYGPDYMIPLGRPIRREDHPEKLYGKLDRWEVPEELR